MPEQHRLRAISSAARQNSKLRQPVRRRSECWPAMVATVAAVSAGGSNHVADRACGASMISDLDRESAAAGRGARACRDNDTRRTRRQLRRASQLSRAKVPQSSPAKWRERYRYSRPSSNRTVSAETHRAKRARDLLRNDCYLDRGAKILAELRYLTGARRGRSSLMIMTPGTFVKF